MSRYGYRVGSYAWKVDANTTKTELDRIKKEKGDLSPDNVLEEARKKDNPIHDNFEWDNKIAGDKFRKQQVRQLLGDFIEITEEVRIRKADEPVIDIEETGNIRQPESVEIKTEKVYYSVKTGDGVDKKHPREYVTNDEIKNNVELHEQTKEKFRSDVRTLIKRYEQFDFLKSEIEVLETLL